MLPISSRLRHSVFGTTRSRYYARVSARLTLSVRLSPMISRQNFREGIPSDDSDEYYDQPTLYLDTRAPSEW